MVIQAKNSSSWKVIKQETIPGYQILQNQKLEGLICVSNTKVEWWKIFPKRWLRSLMVLPHMVEIIKIFRTQFFNTKNTPKKLFHLFFYLFSFRTFSRAHARAFGAEPAERSFPDMLSLFYIFSLFIILYYNNIYIINLIILFIIYYVYYINNILNINIIYIIKKRYNIY
jgi:hypothetical protein